MEQILLNVATGATTLIEAPVPSPQEGHVLIRTRRTLISAGTERMLVDFGRASMIDKARQQPDKVRMILDKVHTDGLMSAIEAVRSKLDHPLALGYCNVGTVMEIGAGVTLLREGDRVVSNGSHAEVVSVPKNLCARVPDNVGDESAVFTVLGAIGLQGIRLVQPMIGETVVVVGLGLIGLMTVQMLRAHGCRVMGVDYDPQRLEMAANFGVCAVDAAAADDLVMRAMDFSRGRGVDAVIITASTESSQPVSQAAKMCRQRGRIVLVGVTGLQLSRQDFYEKEITFQVSCSYGPGRYDTSYEQEGRDYPVGFVRWTEQRNFEAVLDLMASNALNVTQLITHRFPIERAVEAYSVLSGGESSLGIVLQYPEKGPNKKSNSRTVVLDSAKSFHAGPEPVIGCIGAGNYGGRVLIPQLVKAGASLHTLVTTNGLSAAHYGKKFGFVNASTSTTELFQAKEVNALVIATRHDTHASLASEALRNGRHVYVEKPLALNREQLDEVEAAYAESAAKGAAPVIFVGFNRRFSPHVRRMREMLRGTQGPKSLSLLMNAGAISSDHWTQNPQVGGGRILGEACHFIDLARFLVGSRIIGTRAAVMRDGVAPNLDTAQISLQFEDGSIASIQYYANGHRSFPKERVEVFAAGRVLQLDNFRLLRGFGYPRFRSFRTWRQDKGHAACVRAFLGAVKSGGPLPIPAEEIFEVSRVAIEVMESLTV